MIKKPHIDLENIEYQLNATIQPYLTDSNLRSQITGEEPNKKLAEELWKTLNGGGEILLGMHESLADSPNPDLSARTPLKTALAIHTPLFRAYVKKTIDQLAAPYDPEEFHLLWLKQAYTLWKDKLAGLYMVDPDWQNKTLETPAKDLGPLKGSNWIVLLTVYVKQKSNDLKELSLNGSRSY